MQRKILIVDHEAHLRRLIQQALEDLEDDGVERFTVCDGEEALETIEVALLDKAREVLQL